VIDRRFLGALALLVALTGIVGYVVFTNDGSNDLMKIPGETVVEQKGEIQGELNIDGPDSGRLTAEVVAVDDTARQQIIEELDADSYLLWKQYLAIAEQFEMLQLFSFATIETQASLVQAKNQLALLHDNGQRGFLDTMKLLIDLEDRLSGLEISTTKKNELLIELETDLEPTRAALEEVFFLQNYQITLADEYLDFMLIADYETTTSVNAKFKIPQEGAQFNAYQQNLQEFGEALNARHQRAVKILRFPE
jgi:hypothetical protein